MKRVNLNNITGAEYKQLLKRPEINYEKSIAAVKPILDEIKVDGFPGVIKYGKQFGEISEERILIDKSEIEESEKSISSSLKAAIKTAVKNIRTFHERQVPTGFEMETMPGINCGRTFRSIENVGLYIPGGSAPLFSTLLMLAIPAQIAGCRRIVVSTPAKGGFVSEEILYCLKELGIYEAYKLGGAQAIGLMAYGTSEIQPVYKIFGPGNQYVTAAKNLVSIDPDGCAIDMPAGPSEVLIITDETSNPVFTAADLLSQAEHGDDSQVIVVSTSARVLKEVETQVELQLQKIIRKSTAEKSLRNSLLIECESLPQAINFSNNYSPEHLILQINNANEYLNKIQNAGSVFIGNYSPESVGDYASGTNHSLPTYGYAKSFSGVNVSSFMRSMTYQNLTEEGLKSISETVINMADAEGLDAHANAVKVRING